MITPSFNLTATERVLPRLAIDFTTANLDSRITFTRTGATATRVNASGLIETMAANTPRFDFDPITLVCKGLLIEEARVNLILQSSDFTTTWVADGATVTSNSAISPDGTQNADRINSAGANWRMRQDIGILGSTAYTCSAFVKKDNSTTVKFEFASTGGANPSVTGNLYYNFDTNTITGTGSVTSPTVTPYGNGWFRISGVLTTSASHITMLTYCYGGAEYGSAGQTNWWGVQVEAGSFPTSYIPTTTASLTRNADVATMTGTNFSSWYNQSEGTFETQFTSIGFTTNGMLFSSTPGNLTATIQAYWTASTTITTDGGASASMTISGAQNTASNFVYAYKLNNYAMSINAATPSTDLSGTPPSTLSQLNLGHRNGSLIGSQHIRKFMYWPQRLTNAEVQSFSK